MRVDLHNHVVPERVLELVRGDAAFGVDLEGSSWRWKDQVEFEVTPSFRDPAAKLTELKANELDAAVVSVAPPIFGYQLQGERAQEFCTATNEGLAEFCEHSPEAYRWMAHVPMQDPELAVEILDQAASMEGCCAIQIGSSVAGRRLDEESYEPFWSAVERLQLPVMIHPIYSGDAPPQLEAYYLVNAIGFPLETTVAIERLICAGVLSRHPGLRILLVHAGGYFPYQAGRLRHTRSVRPELADAPEDPWDFLPQLWFDVITHDPGALRFLVDRVGLDRVVMGTDLPFDMALPNPVQAVSEAVGPEAIATVAETNPAAFLDFSA
jgi:aminocarboxymuconate-semialdehyde decarboxylase